MTSAPRAPAARPPQHPPTISNARSSLRHAIQEILLWLFIRIAVVTLNVPLNAALHYKECAAPPFAMGRAV